MFGFLESQIFNTCEHCIWGST